MQPWASLLALGIKTIETRRWATDYRGPLLIHASKSRAGKSIHPQLQEPSILPDFEVLPFGAIIAEAQLVDIVRCETLILSKETFESCGLEENAFGPKEGKYCWLFKHAVCLDEIIPATGRLGLWEW